MSLKMLVHEHYKPAPLTSPGWTWVLPDFSTLSFLISGTTADLVPQFAAPSTVKRQIQKEKCQRMLSCEIKCLGGTPSLHPGCASSPGGARAGWLWEGRVGIWAQCCCCPELWERGRALQPLCSSQCVSLGWLHIQVDPSKQDWDS